MQTVAQLCRQIVMRYGIAANNIVAHGDCASVEKHNPSVYFNWQLFYSIVGVYPQLFDSRLSLTEQERVLLSMSTEQFDINTQILQQQLKKLVVRMFKIVS